MNLLGHRLLASLFWWPALIASSLMGGGAIGGAGAVMLALVPTPAHAIFGECRWEGGAGYDASNPDPALKHCQEEDCIGNGGFAECVMPHAAPIIENLHDADGWFYNVVFPYYMGFPACDLAGGVYQQGAPGDCSVSTLTADASVAVGWALSYFSECSESAVEDSGWLFVGDLENDQYGQLSGGGPGFESGVLIRDGRRIWFPDSPSCGGTDPGTRNQLLVARSRTVVCPRDTIPRRKTPASDLECWRPAPSVCIKAGNPVDLASCAKQQAEVDYRASGAGTQLELVRYFDSGGHTFPGAAEHSLGAYYHWQHTYERRLIPIAGNPNLIAIVQDGSGTRRYFDGTGTDVWNTGKSKSHLVFTSDVGYQLTLANGDRETYDVNGRLTSIVSRGGMTTTVSHNSGGKVSSVTGPFGHQLVFTYNTSQQLTQVTLPGGAIAYGYDLHGNLATVTYPDSTQKVYLYEDPINSNLLTGIKDETGQRFATYVYNASGQVTSENHSGVEQYQFSNSQYYDAPSQSYRSQTTVVDPLGNTRSYDFAAIKGVYRLQGASGCPSCDLPQSQTFDLNGNPATTIDQNGNITTHIYDLLRNLETSRTEAYGTPRARTITTQWNPTYHLPTQIDEPGKQTTFTHDANGNTLTKTVLDTATSQSRTWTLSYDAFGRVLTEDGPRTDVSDVTTYMYYSCAAGSQCGQVHTIIDALGHVTTFNTYNAHGQPQTITDPNGVVTTLTYDLRQRLTSRTFGGEQTIFEYWPTGLLKKATLADGSFLQYTDDAAHRLTQITDAEGSRVVYTLDSMGNRTGEQHYDPSNVLTQTRTRVFNALNQLWKEIGAPGTAAVTTEFGYDDNGNQTSIAAPLNRNTAQQYDELNRLKQVTDPLSGITQYGYNPLNQLISVTDPRGLNTAYSYNALDDLLTQSSPDSGVTTHTYDEAGSVATRTDARGASVGRGVYAHDALNRVTQIQYPDHTITYSYDSCLNGVGRLCGMTDASGSTIYEYDQQGRVTRKSQSTPVGGSTHTRTVRYEYASGHLAAVRMPGGQRINYTYDVVGRIWAMSITWPDNSTSPLLSDVLYDPAGRVRGWTWANGTFEVREYDQDGRITDIDNAGASQYGYDDADRITSITSLAGNTSPSWSYGYDLLDRLEDAARSGLAESFTYDANGNRLAQGGTQASTYSYTSPLTSNRLQSVAGALSRTYSYDAMGNITGNGIVSFGYNGAGRMSSAGSAIYGHNGLGQRTTKSLWANDLTSYMYDEAGRLLEKCDVSSAGQCASFFSTQYIWLDDIPVAALLPYVQYNEEGYVSVFYVGFYNVHPDHLNTPRRFTRRDDGAVVWQWDPDPFGVGLPNANVLGDPNAASDLDLRFPGQIFDPENWPWLHYNYFRDYDSAVGRYVESDPIGLRGGLNTYAYADGNPLTNIDRFGLTSSSCCQQTFGDCVQKCLQDRLGEPIEYVNNLVALGLTNSVALTRIRIPGTPYAGPAGQVIPGLLGRRLGTIVAGAVGRGIGGQLGAVGGRGLIYGLAIAGSFAAGYAVGSVGYCFAVCSADNCYY